MRLLIAEDQQDLAEALSSFFEKNHFSVDAVYNGFDAYEYAVTGEYDAVILDVMMPKLDGIQVLQRLRSEGLKTPIMMLTAKGEKAERITGFNAGADDYLPKPFDPDELFLRSPRQVFSAERIMEKVWGWDNEAEINVVWVNISNLRKKLKSLGSRVTLRANRGLGYVLEESV